MGSKRLVILISGSGSNLQAFIEKQQQGSLGGTIVSVISNNPEAYGLTRAREAGIKAVSLDHKTHASRESFDKELAEEIKKDQPDLIILAGFMRILTPEFVQTFRGKLLNIHPSLLPKYPGLHTHKKALENNDEFHGTSVHFVTEELDGGPLIAQSQMRLIVGSESNEENELNEQQVMQRIQKLEHRLYPEVASWYLNNRLTMEKDGVYFDHKKLERPILFGD
ncbi:phosphoribosylglycinamide formyltransferase [Aliikangiella coralliicola]|uniref:Phosphoribosylglycinamide formyltransferase n=1 Tax=Aliikangiella coralliicola TaxID=2592383 RepID=A0A545U540_9GAMM|nr:phosphoribosylglycinamide formyltransferase [Aliikangiella coralliicola]TQV84523.1 phosphoribosylglycinamide formyltransferase [Aliikangiella coralliicola]